MVPMSPPSSDRSSGVGNRVTRRWVLAGICTGATTALAGCGSVLGQTDRRSLNPPEVIDDSPTARVWEFPRGASDENTPIQTYLEQEYRVPTTPPSVDVPFQFGATVFEHSKYHHNQITLRLQAPADLQASRPPADIFVEPLTGGFSFRAYQQDRETIISLSDLDEAGTLQLAFLVNPRTRPVPETVGYEFEIVAENDQLFGKNVVASESGRFPVAFEDE